MRVIEFKDKSKREMYLDSTIFSSVQKLIQKLYNFWKSYICAKKYQYNRK